MNHMPQWILKKKYKALEDNFSWSIPFMKLSGLVFIFGLAFSLTFGIVKSTKDTFVENSNAIYGLKFNQVFQDLGFQDGMRISSINDEKIDRVSDILTDIIIEEDEVKVAVELNGIQQNLIIGMEDKMALIRKLNSNPIVPIMNGSNGGESIKQTTKDFGFSHVIGRFEFLWNEAKFFLSPSLSPYKRMGGFKPLSENTSFSGYLTILSLYLLFVGLLNLLPLPGFGFGNFIISTIETIRKKLFNKKRKRVLGIISIFLVIVYLGIGWFM